MRQALNSNPLVQVGLIALLGVGVVFLLMTNLKGGETAPPADTATAPATAGAPPAPAAPAEGAAPAVPAEPGAPAVPEPPATEFAAGPGLPEKFVDAYDDGDTTVLLITRKGGIDDKVMRKVVDFTKKDAKDVTVFEILAREIAKYSRITQGVDVDRVPAMIVLSPKNVSGDVPLASVSYGFRGPDSVKQAIADARFKGEEIPYFPE